MVDFFLFRKISKRFLMKSRRVQFSVKMEESQFKGNFFKKGLSFMEIELEC